MNQNRGGPTILVASKTLELQDVLKHSGEWLVRYRVESVHDAAALVQRVKFDSNLSLILIDASFDESQEGSKTLEVLGGCYPTVPVIVWSLGTCADPTTTSMRGSAVSYLPKSGGRDMLVRAVRNILQSGSVEVPKWTARHGASEATFPKTSAWNQKLDLLLERIGASDVPMLLRGETGVGKEVLARRLHDLSVRAGQPFLKLNCAALPSELVESELFGYEKGAFTGALKRTAGKFEMADKGTILLDEIGDMDFKLQAKLLQVVQDHEFLRLGSSETTKVNVRVMAATHCDLEHAIEEGRFREDLYYRLNIIDIQIPPLRERTDEILTLAEHFIQVHSTAMHPPLPISRTFQQVLLNHSWPGNVRELENVVRKFLVLRSEGIVIEELVRNANRRNQIGQPRPLLTPALRREPASIQRSSDGSNLEDVDNSSKAAERKVILNALESARWNRKQAAELLKVDYKALLYRMKKLGIGDTEAKAG